jgi:predicted Ser/Thr protein kinase
MKNLPEPSVLLTWIHESLAHGENVLTTSNQGTLLLYSVNGQELIIKTPMGNGLLRKARQKTLLREYRAYRHLHGVAGVPECYGLLEGRYLLLEYVKGKPYREATWSDRDQWFDELLLVLRDIHARGVSHGDLKTKGNLLVTEDEKPCVIDFGTAFIEEPGFHPVNNWLFRMARQMDINAWVKHKYRGQYGNASEADNELLDYSWIERLVRRVRGRPMGGINSAAQRK